MNQGASAHRLGSLVCGGHASEDGGDGGAIRGEGIELITAALRHLRNAPGRGAGGPDGHDERRARPQVVGVGAAEFRRRLEGREHLDPLSAHGAGVGVAGHGVRVRGGGGGRGGGAPGEGEGEAAFDGIEVRALGQGQESLVTETSGCRRTRRSTWRRRLSGGAAKAPAAWAREGRRTRPQDQRTKRSRRRRPAGG